jgi:hypothetical protein
VGIPLSEAGTRGRAPVRVRVRLTEVGADVETREGADVETGEGADVETGEGADAWVAVT